MNAWNLWKLWKLWQTVKHIPPFIWKPMSESLWDLVRVNFPGPVICQSASASVLTGCHPGTWNGHPASRGKVKPIETRSSMSKTCQNCIEVMTFQDHQPLKKWSQVHESSSHPVPFFRLSDLSVPSCNFAWSQGNAMGGGSVWKTVSLGARAQAPLQVLRKRARRRRSKSTSLNESCWKGEEPLWYVGTLLVLHQMS